MSFQYKGACYNTPESVLAAMAADMSGAGVDLNGQPASFFTQVEGSSLKTISSTGAVSVITPQMIDCQLITMPQAAAISLSVALCWAIAFGYRAMSYSLDAGGDS